MPRSANQFGNVVNRVPFDFEEIVDSLAPRQFLTCVAERDDDFSGAGVREVMEFAQAVYRLYGAEQYLASYNPPTLHPFSLDTHQQASQFLDLHLKS